MATMPGFSYNEFQVLSTEVVAMKVSIADCCSDLLHLAGPNTLTATSQFLSSTHSNKQGIGGAVYFLFLSFEFFQIVEAAILRLWRNTFSSLKNACPPNHPKTFGAAEFSLISLGCLGCLNPVGGTKDRWIRESEIAVQWDSRFPFTLTMDRVAVHQNIYFM